MNNFKPSHGSMPNSLKNASIKPSSQESEVVSLSSSNSYVKKQSVAQNQLADTAPVSNLSSARKDSVFPLSPAKAI